VQSFAKPLLEHWKVDVQDIPTADSEQSDFLATVGGCTALIEEKTKLDNPDRLEKRRAKLDAGEVYSSSRPIVRDNRLSGVVRKAAAQLASSSAAHKHDFRLVWFTATGYEAEPLYHQFIATLYGSTNIIEMGSQHFRSCYFFRNSDFHRFRDTIDGAVAASVQGTKLSAKLCLNPLSARIGTLRDSAFAKLFGTAVEDPQALEANGEAFILGSNAERGAANEAALLSEIQRKYETRPLMTLDFGHHSAAMAYQTSEQ